MTDSFWGKVQGWLGKPVQDAAGPRGERPTGPVPARRERQMQTAPPSIEDLQKESEERRYLISAWEASPDLIPEFRQPTYMYKLITTEREYVQAQLHALQQARAALAASGDEDGGEAAAELESREISLRMDLTRLFRLIKKVTGVQKSGTGGTDFIPM
ncbi:MAG: hypothetical protein VKO21_05650 [Candidatus Sericytochromatia bacterium]|nr:hypothetical protein [Candidatus Sericytochromatia bacterium]